MTSLKHDPAPLPTPEQQTGSPGDDALLPHLLVVDEQPLAQRAEAYVQLHDELRARLEGGDAPLPAGRGLQGRS